MQKFLILVAFLFSFNNLHAYTETDIIDSKLVKQIVCETKENCESLNKVQIIVKTDTLSTKEVISSNSYKESENTIIFFTGTPYYQKDDGKWYLTDSVNITVSEYEKILSPTLINYLKILKIKIALAVDDFFPSFDGWVRYTGSSSYTTTRNALSGTATDTGSSDQPVRHSFYSGSGLFEIMRPAFTFDTSSLPDTAEISAVTLSFYGMGSKQDTDSDSVSIVSANLASSATITDEDYDQFGTTKFASDISISSWSTSAYNDFTLNQDGIDNISFTGNTVFGMRTANDISGTEPTGQNLVEYYTSEQTGTANDPKLSITYTVPSPSPSPTPTTEATTTSIVQDSGDVVFMLGFLVFLNAFLVIGLIFNTFLGRK